MASSSSTVKQRRRDKEFLWVNKDSASSQLSRSDRQEASSILKFVQRNREPNRRRRPRSKVTHDFIAFETDVQNEAPSSSGSHSQNSEVVLTENLDLWNAVRSMSNRWRLSVPVNNFAPGDTVDPFASAVVPITEPIFGILQYCKASVVVGASGYRLAVFPEEIRPMTDMYQSVLVYLFRHMVQFKHIMYPILAAYSRLMQALREPSLQRTQNPDWYLQMALQAVRASLAENGEDEEVPIHIATGVHLLICSSGLGGHFEDSRTHIRAFLRLLPHMDTKSPIGFWELDTVSSLDIMMASASGTVPMIKFSTSDPGSLTARRMMQFKNKLEEMQQEEDSTSSDPVNELSASFRRHEIQSSHNEFDLLQNPVEDLDLHLGSSLQKLLAMSMLDPPVSVVLKNILDCLTVAKVVWKAPEFVTKHDTKWLCQKSRTVLHELLCMVGHKGIDVSNNGGRVSEALRITLLMIMISVQYRSVSRLARGSYGGPLRKVLTPLLDGDWNALQLSLQEQSLRGGGTETEHEDGERVAMDLNELLLWILLTAQWATSGTEDESWFAHAAAKVALQRLGLSGTGLEKVMRKYLYSRTAQHRSLEKVADLMPF